MTLPSLAKDPRKYAAEWKVCTRDLASILVTAYHPNGLLDIGIVDTDAEYRAAHPDVIPDEGGVVSVCYTLAKSWCGKIVLRLSGQETMVVPTFTALYPLLRI